MISFSTEFPIAEKNSVRDVLRLACDTIESSPHTKIPKRALAELPAEGETEFCFGNESVTVALARSDEYEIGGVRYSRLEKNSLEWTITSVTFKTAERHLLSIQVSCEALNTAIRLPAPQKPFFVGQVISKLGGGADGLIPVTDQPFRLDNEEVDAAAQLIRGSAENRLPIVYVSVSNDGAYIVDPDRLAGMLSGMAHVVVEPSREFSRALKTLVDGRNVYGGTVGVYWPESNARKAYFVSAELSTPDAVHSEIAKDIRVALSHRRQMTDCSWLHLRETISKNRYEKLKSEGSTELNQYIEAFDAEIKAKGKRIEEAESEISRLNAEVKRLEAMNQTRSSGLLERGKESDFYENEIKDFVLEAIELALRNVVTPSRREHVLADLLKANAKTGKAEQFRTEIKNIFKSSGSLDAKTRSVLERLGFDISEDGKHHKAVFHGDGRYTFSISKSASDHRSGKNMASDINRTLF